MTAATSKIRGQQQQRPKQQHHNKQQCDATTTARPTSSAAMSKKNSISTAASAAGRLATAAFALTTANAAIFNVSPDGDPMTLTAALDMAMAGDTISLGDGIYREPIVTMHAGEEGKPLVIEGGRGAVINYFSGDRSLMWSQKVVDVRHSWITLRGFTIDGHLDDKEEEESYVDKCIWVEGQDEPTMVPHSGREVESSLIGTVIEDMKIQNCGMECIRMRNWVTNSVIRDNDIEDCGIYDYRFQFDGKIGEAIYIGTSSNQWTDGEDVCSYNLVTGNKLVPRANECVDVKEGSTMNVIEYNDCQDQRDSDSGCFDSRGNDNTFRYNTAEGCEGAGIRLGGHVINGFVFGVDNHVYGNDFSETEGGSIKARRDPQGVICGNSCTDGDCEVDEEGDDEEIEESWDQTCPSVLPSVPFIDDAEGPTPTPPTPITPPTPSPPMPDKTIPTPTETADDDEDDDEDDDDDPTPAPQTVVTPTTTSSAESFACEDGVIGGEYCCSAGCGECGGDECSDRGDGLDGGDCCRSDIEDSGDLCSVTGRAPCRLDDVQTEPSFTCVGVVGDDVYCCPAGCGECGGKGCSSRGEGLGPDDCCQSKIKENGNKCSETGKAPCVM
ncbi:unnamed protein product [Pylaiella littoralis]